MVCAVLSQQPFTLVQLANQEPPRQAPALLLEGSSFAEYIDLCKWPTGNGIVPKSLWGSDAFDLPYKEVSLDRNTATEPQTLT